MSKKHEVLKTFRDKETGQIILAGSSFGVKDNKRLEDMFNRGLLKEEDEVKEPIKEEDEVKEPVKEEDEVKEPVKKATTRKKSGE